MKIKLQNNLHLLDEEYKSLVRPIYQFFRANTWRSYQEISWAYCNNSYSFEGEQFIVPPAMDQEQYNLWFCKEVDKRFAFYNPAEISEIVAIIEDVSAIIGKMLIKSYKREKHESDAKSMATFATTLQHTPDRG